MAVKMLFPNSLADGLTYIHIHGELQLPPWFQPPLDSFLQAANGERNFNGMRYDSILQPETPRAR